MGTVQEPSFYGYIEICLYLHNNQRGSCYVTPIQWGSEYLTSWVIRSGHLNESQTFLSDIQTTTQITEVYVMEQVVKSVSQIKQVNNLQSII